MNNSGDTLYLAATSEDCMHGRRRPLERLVTLAQVPHLARKGAESHPRQRRRGRRPCRGRAATCDLWPPGQIWRSGLYFRRARQSEFVKAVVQISPFHTTKFNLPTHQNQRLPQGNKIKFLPPSTYQIMAKCDHKTALASPKKKPGSAKVREC